MDETQTSSAAPGPDDLGPAFDERWKLARQQQRRALLADLQDIYHGLDQGDPASLDPTHDATTHNQQASQFARGLLSRLLRGQALDETRVRAALESAPPTLLPVPTELEATLRERLEQHVDRLIDDHMQAFRAELRIRLMAELDDLLKGRR